MKNIITMRDGIPMMENPLGCRWTPVCDGGRWGLGTFSCGGVDAGKPVLSFLEEDSVKKQYTLTGFSILENTPERGVLEFSGTDAKLFIRVRATMTGETRMVEFAYSIDPIHPVYHRVFVRLPFCAKNAAFIKYPYEDTLDGNAERWSVETDISRMPMVLGCLETQGKQLFLGAGYHLSEAFDQGRFEIDIPENADAPLKLFSQFKGMCRAQDLQCITPLELLHRNLDREREESIRHFRVIVSMGETQYDCVKGYLDGCGYDKDAFIKYSVEDSVERLMNMYRDMPGYIKGKGYPQLCRTDTGKYDSTIPHGWYSKTIAPGPGCLLGYELYEYWIQHPEEDWARERAFEIGDFLVQCQAESGLFTAYNIDTGEFRKSNPEDLQSEALYGYFYNTDDMCLGAYHLYLLHDRVLASEGIAHPEWKEAAQRTLRFIIRSTSEHGELGRNYNAFGGYDTLCPAVSSALIALDYMYQDTGESEVDDCRARIENWVYETRVKRNDYSDGCMDGGAWVGGGKPPKNNDAIGLMGFICYCVKRYQTTGDTSYIQKAKDTFAYQVLASVPVQIQGYDFFTTGLVREQDFYSAYDLPMRVNDYIDCLPYLSVLTGDPFFMQFMRIILQTEMDYQDRTNKYQSFHIGLESGYDARTPQNKMAETVNIFILRFAPTFIKSVSGPFSYQYVSNGKWAFGRDYYLPFTCPPEGAPYVQASTNMIRNQSWDAAGKQLHIWAYSRETSDGVVIVKCNTPGGFSGSAATVTVEGGNSVCETSFDEKTDELCIHATNPDAPSRMLDVKFC